MAVEGCLRRFYFLKTGVPFQTKALVAVESCLRRFYFLNTGAPLHTKALVAVEGCLRRFYFLKTGSPVIKVRDTREGSQAKYERNE